MGARSSKAISAKTQGAADDHDQLHKQNNKVYHATSLPIGCAVRYDKMLVQIRKNTPIPTNKFEATATTTYDNMESFTLSIYQGERKKASANQLLGTLVVEGIPPAPKGVAKVTISLDVDAEGNLNVSVQEKSTGRKLASKSIPGVGVKAGKPASSTAEDEEYSKKMNAMKALEEYAIVIRENAAAGAYSRKAMLAFDGVVQKMLDEFKDKAKEFGSEAVVGVI